ncbi:calcium-binding protein, partial [Nostoc sp. FACHB-110]|uniref:calcium-binding protein n=1 Tax=Nostoc sp. FACHB-110 TaxID=2692834 RepID=UPI001983DEB9|nr:calcium-binding protein [Nostoc sp. FACHB-110]
YSQLGNTITLSGVGTITKAGDLGQDTLLKVETVIADASVANNTIDTSASLSGVSVVADLENQTISAVNVPSLGTITFNVINFDNVIGTNESDTLTGDSQNNQFTGLGGNDTIIGGAGDDTIIGGLGNDLLTGGTGADQFIFNSLAEAFDTITDYSFTQQDVIQISQVGFGATDISQFVYNSTEGSLSFLGTQFAVLSNLSADVSIQLI